jgi:hypothetical protein
MPPVVWIYTMTMEPQDFVSILKLGLLLFYLIFFAGKYTIMRRKFYQIYRREDVQKENNEAVQVQH